MGFPRRAFGAFSLEVPPGLFDDEDAPAGFAAALTAIAPATLRIRRIDAPGAASLSAVMVGLCPGGAQEVTAKGEACLWPGLTAEASGHLRRLHFLFESGGMVVHGLAEAPAGLWADYGIFLEGAMLTIDFGEGAAPTLPLFPDRPVPEVLERPAEESPVEAIRRRLAAVSHEAAALIAALRFDDAELMVRRVDADVYGANALANAYEAALEAAPSNPALLDRAIFWARSAFPAAHTASEADAYADASASREARLRQIARA